MCRYFTIIPIFINNSGLNVCIPFGIKHNGINVCFIPTGITHNDINDVYTNWIFNIVTKPKRKMCKFLSGVKKCFKEPKPPTVRQASDMASKMTKTNFYSYFGEVTFCTFNDTQKPPY